MAVQPVRDPQKRQFIVLTLTECLHLGGGYFPAVSTCSSQFTQASMYKGQNLTVATCTRPNILK